MNDNVTVRNTEVFHLVAGEAMSTPVLVDMSYMEQDPWAVRFTFRTGHDVRVAWTFGRSLLAAGLTHGVGEGDVRIRPEPGERRLLAIEVRAPHGNATFTAPLASVAEFLDATYRVAGQEHAQSVVDAQFDAFDWSPA